MTRNDDKEEGREGCCTSLLATYTGTVHSRTALHLGSKRQVTRFGVSFCISRSRLFVCWLFQKIKASAPASSDLFTFQSLSTLRHGSGFILPSSVLPRVPRLQPRARPRGSGSGSHVRRACAASPETAVDHAGWFPVRLSGEQRL